MPGADEVPSRAASAEGVVDGEGEPVDAPAGVSARAGGRDDFDYLAGDGAKQ
jgi:hypothetical protein